MVFLSGLKSTFLLWVLLNTSCGKPIRNKVVSEGPKTQHIQIDTPKTIIVGANRTALFLPLLEGKKVGIVANQTTVIFKGTNGDGAPGSHIHLVDSLLTLKIDIKKVFAPEHGFRGEADAGEKVTDGFDQRSGLPLISLYGKNRKPTADQLKDLDLVVFDIQDVGVRFYTYIATLQLVMEACAEFGVPVLVLDRPNPNGHYVDGPTMEKEHMGFLGMAPIPLVYGMSIGEYAKMINEEGWLAGNLKADLTVIPLANWSHESEYALPIRPSPNLPNDSAINLYPSLGLFEGTNINAGRGTESQFQRFGAPFLDPSFFDFSYTPIPNFGSKTPKHNGTVCYGKDLSKSPRLSEVRLQWLIDAYAHALDKNKVFNESGFTKHAGTAKLQQQIEAGLSEAEIKASWQADLERFKEIRERYLIYE
jgi:uncharacterized protein YbbC (DUF1343 family)